MTARELKAFGVKRLEANEVSKVVRIRTDAKTMQQIKALTPKELGAL